MKKRIAGIVIVLLSLGALGFWELWGRENITYDRILVLKESQPKNTLITWEMVEERRMEDAGEDVILSKDGNQIVGLATTQYIPAGTELYSEYFRKSEFAVGEEEGKYILSLPEQWLISYPHTLRRGDKAFFYCGGEIITGAVVAHVRDSANQEVYYGQEERFTASASVSLIEVIVTAEQAELIGRLAGKGNKFVILYY